MTKVLRSLLLVLLAVPAMGMVVVYCLSELSLRDIEPSPPFAQAIVADSTTVKRGKHLALTRGCFGCHGEQLQGRVFENPYPWPARAVAANLPAYARKHDTATINAAIREGIGQDGHALWAMPSYNFRHLSDQDLVALIAYFRSVVPVDHELPSPKLGWRVRWALATGAEEHMVDFVAKVPGMTLGPDDVPNLVKGECLAMTTCNECHGLDLRGVAMDGFGTPDLAIVSAYSIDDFTRLLREGIALGGRDELPLMSTVSRGRFVHFTDEEINDLYTFLRTLPSAPIPTEVDWRQ